jgi:hypothetical protein
VNGANGAREGETMTAPGLADLTSYLRSAGWTLEDDDERTMLWRPQASAGNDVQVVLPAKEQVRDFSDRVQEALRAIAYVERRLPREVLEDIAIGGADTVAVRLTPNLPSGEAPLGLAHTAINSLWTLVVASASSLDSSSLVLSSRKSKRAETYADKARFSTQPGSFVLSLSLPLEDGFPEPQVQGEIDGQEDLLPPVRDPFGRRVTRRMMLATRHAQKLAAAVSEGTESLAAFGRQTFVNATELAALGGLGGPEHDLYQVRFALSPRAGGQASPELLRITPGEQRILREAAEYLRTKQPRTGVTVTGHVIRLFRENGTGPGEVVILGVDDDTGIPRRIRVELVKEDYTRALNAHAQGLLVTATGDLEIRGNRRSLRKLSSFSVLSGIEDE